MALNTNDIVAIQQLYAAYNLAIDDADGPAYAGCFTPDGFVGGAGSGPPVVGRDALARFAASMRPGLRHVVVNMHADGNGDEAEGRAYFAAFSVGGGSVKVLTTGTYRDRLQRVDGVWLFAERAYSPDA